MISLEGKTILITGASSGIGRQCAIDASKIGANVIIVGRNQERLDRTRDMMKDGNHIIFALDITEYSRLEGIVNQATERLGKISGFIHSAGIEKTLPFKDMSPAEYETIFAINVIAGLEIARIVSKKKYLSEDRGSFIFVSSIMGIIGQRATVGYCCSKGALIPATKSLALELAPRKVRVNAVLPGVLMTEMTERFFSKMNEEAKEAVIRMHPLGLGKPEDVSNVCMFLLSDLSKWITGTSITVDGGYTAA
jgi:NAD(P)-dependent dehydrogenase (short-subunit alcohol dehydrogenase family)